MAYIDSQMAPGPFAARRPDFVVAGAPKCGTTALQRFLEGQEGVFVPPEKEPHFFCPDIGLRKKTSAERYRSLFTDAPPDVPAGEVSIWYLCSREAPSAIRSYCGPIRIVAMLRNPIDAMYSLHSQLVFNGDEDIDDFEQALAAEGDRRRGHRLPAESWKGPQCHCYRHVFSFGAQLEAYVREFGRERLHVLLLEDILARPDETLRRLLDFLGVDGAGPLSLPLANPNKVVRSQRLLRFQRKGWQSLRKVARLIYPADHSRQRLGRWLQRRLRSLNASYVRRPPLDPRLRRRLADELAGDVALLRELLDRDLDVWRDFEPGAKACEGGMLSATTHGRWLAGPVDARSTRAAGAADPFVPMAGRHRLVIIAGAVLYLLLVGAAASLHPVSASLWVFLGLSANVALLLVPIVTLRRGWLHPLVFSALATFLGSHLVRTPLYVEGMRVHVALQGVSRQELTELVAGLLFLQAFGLAAYYAGFFSRLQPSVPRFELPAPRQLVRRALLIVGVSGAAFLLYLSWQGGISGHLLAWAREGRADAVMGLGHWIKISRLGSLACFVWFTWRREALRSPLFWAATALSLSINFMGTGSRSSILLPLVAGFVVWLLRSGTIRLGRALAILALVLVALTSLGRLRATVVEEQVDFGVLWDRSVGGSIQAASDELVYRYGSQNSAYPILARVPDRVDLLWGRSYLDLVTLPIPRALWPDKPLTVGRTAAAVFAGADYGLPPEAIAEAYWNFHLPGVLAVFFCFGVMHRWLERFLILHSGSPTAHLVFATVLIYLRQPSHMALAGFFYQAASLLLVLWLLGALAWRRVERA